jgi:hypothetical protein
MPNQKQIEFIYKIFTAANVVIGLCKVLSFFLHVAIIPNYAAIFFTAFCCLFYIAEKTANYITAVSAQNKIASAIAANAIRI